SRAGGEAMLRSNAMTIGQLSRRTGVPIKVLREYEDLGFLYTLGRSESNYRLFGDEALWRVQVVQGLRSLGATLQELQALFTKYVEHPSEPIGNLLDQYLARALTRVEARIADLQTLRQRIRGFQVERGATSAPSELVRSLASDPRRHPVPSAS